MKGRGNKEQQTDAIKRKTRRGKSQNMLSRENIFPLRPRGAHGRRGRTAAGGVRPRGAHKAMDKAISPPRPRGAHGRRGRTKQWISKGKAKGNRGRHKGEARVITSEQRGEVKLEIAKTHHMLLFRFQK